MNATITITPKQARHIAGCILADVSLLIYGSLPKSQATRSAMADVRATLDTREEWLDQLERVGDDGNVTWTASKPELASVAVDLLAKGLDDVVTDDILQHGANALEHIAAREWLSMAETALTIRDQLADA